MSQTSTIETYAGAVADLQVRWPKLTPGERLAALQSIVDGVAKQAGFPSPNVKLDPSLGTGRNGELHFQSWDIAINPALCSKAALSDEELCELSNTIFHETRHAEQWWLIARRDAAEGLTAEQIMTQRDIKNISVIKAAKKAPLEKGEPSRDCADLMYDSVYGKSASARNTKLKALAQDGASTRAAVAKVNASERAYKVLSADPKATEAQKAAALKAWKDDYLAWQVASKISDASYKEYRALPEEADAWDAGARAGKSTADALRRGRLP